jgi:putative sterol carrier protein
MSLAQVEQTIRSRLTDFMGLGAVVKLDLENEGVLTLDGKAMPPTLTAGDSGATADCTLRLSSDTMLKLLSGDADPTMSFMMGKLKVDGSMGYALKLAGMLEG